MDESQIVTTEKIGEGVVKYLNDEIENLDKSDRINLTELYLHLPDSKVEDKLREMLESKGGKVSIIINLVPTEVIESLTEVPEATYESVNKEPSDNIYIGALVAILKNDIIV